MKLREKEKIGKEKNIRTLTDGCTDGHFEIKGRSLLKNHDLPL